jgi:GH15 family glucan-1,4-alpha-glucosidase
MALPIEDYAALGDGNTAALVGRDGSIDWLCLPRFDSHACFAALLGDPDNGRWLIGPAGRHTSTRRYVGDTGVLETTYTSRRGTVVVTDLMPVNDKRADLVRRITGVEGSMRMVHEWVVRPDYGRIRPWVHRERRGDRELIVAIAGPDKLVLRGPRLPLAVDGRHRDEFVVNEGDVLTFSTTWIPSHLPVPRLLEFDGRIQETIDEHQAWADECSYDGPWRAEVVRSLVTLRGLTHAQTGGIVAAPRPACRRTSAANATGTTATAGCGTPRSRSTRCSRPAARRSRSCGAGGCSARWPETPRTSRSCTPSTAAGTSPSASSTISPATRAAARCGSATVPSSSGRPTCSERSCTRSTRPAAPA